MIINHRYFYLPVLLLLNAVRVSAQGHPCLDSLNFFLRNHIKTIDVVTTDPEQKIVNHIRYSFNKKTRILKICSVLDEIDSAKTCNTVPFEHLNDSSSSPKSVTICEFDKYNRIVKKIIRGETRYQGEYTDRRHYYYADTVSNRLKLRTLETKDYSKVNYFYYHFLGGNVLGKNVILTTKYVDAKTSVSSHLYEYDSDKLLKREIIYKDNALLCTREFSYEFYLK